MKKKLVVSGLVFFLVLLSVTPALTTETISLDEEQYVIEDYCQFQELDSPKVAVALSGGGARALVNIGVLKALVEERIPIDLITGTSMGSIIGTMYGSGLSIEQIEDIATKNPFAQLLDLNFTSNKSLLKTAQVNKFIEEIAPHKKLENFPTPTALLSYDLTTGNKYLTTTGQISEVIQGSYAIPHYFPHYQKNNHYLIDPGMLEMSPAKSAKILGADFVIATTAFDKVPYTKYNTPSRSVGRFITLMQEQNGKKILSDYADIVINNKVGNYSFMDFKKAQELIQLGYQTTREQIPHIKQSLKSKKIHLAHQQNRPKIELEQEFNLLKNDRLINNNLVINPIFHTGKETNFLTHNSLTTYFKQAEYGMQLEKDNIELKILTTNNSNQDLDLQFRWKQLTPNTDWLFKSKSEINNHNYSNFKTEIKYYQLNNNYSFGLGNIADNIFLYAGSQYELGIPKENIIGEIDLIYSEDNKLKAIFSQESTFALTDIWKIKPKISFNNTEIIPSPLIYRGSNPKNNIKLQAGIDLTYNHDFIDPIELSVLQLTNMRFYTFIDYKDSFNNSYAYGLGNKTNFNLLGLKPIDIETYIAFDNHHQNFKSLLKLNYQF